MQNRYSTTKCWGQVMLQHLSKDKKSPTIRRAHNIKTDLLVRPIVTREQINSTTQATVQVQQLPAQFPNTQKKREKKKQKTNRKPKVGGKRVIWGRQNFVKRRINVKQSINCTPRHAIFPTPTLHIQTTLTKHPHNFCCF